MKKCIRPMLASGTHVVSPGEAHPPLACGCDCCGCFIIPHHVLERFAKDKKLTGEQREHFANAAKIERDWRRVRAATG